MEQELYYLIFRFLYEGPCQDAAYALAQEFKKHRELLPKSSLFDGSGSVEGGGEAATLQQLSEAYPRIGGDYLPNLLRHLLHYFRMTQSLDANQRARLYQHGDDNLFTLLSAFEVARANPTRYTYMSVPTRDLYHLSLHEMIQALEIGKKVTRPHEMPTTMSTFYRERVTMSGHRQHVYCLAFDKADARLFTGSDDFLVKVWNVRTGHLVYTIRGHQNVITDIAINEENTLIATASSDGYVRVWKMENFEPVAHLRTQTSAQRKPFTTVKFSPSPKAETRYLMATNEDGLVRLWRWDKDTLIFYDVDSPITFSCKFKASDRLRCSSFDATGTHFTVAGDDGFVYVFSTVKGDSDGNHVVQTIQQDGSGIQPVSSESGQRPRVVGRGRPRVPSALFPDKTGAFEDQPVIPIAHLEGHFGSVTDLAYSHDGKKILSGSQDGTARIWVYDKITQTWDSTVLDINKDILVAPVVTTDRQPNKAHDTDFSGVDNDAALELGSLIPPCSPIPEDQNSSSLADTSRQVPQDNSNNNNVTTMNVDNSDEVGLNEAVDPIPSKVSMITWSADDRVCIIATSQGELKVYYAHTGKLACVLKGHEGEVFAVESHPTNPSLVLSAGYDGRVIIWDIKRHCAISCTTYPGRVFLDCKFSQTGHKYAITDEDGRCTLFSIDGDSGNYKMVNSWHRGQFFYSDFLPVSVRPDGSVVDEQSLRPLHQVERRPINDQSGVEYPSQCREGYGTNLPLQPEGLETRIKQRERTYEMEEEEFKNGKPIKMEAVDRSLLAKKRRNFVKNDEEDESEATLAETQFFQPTVSIPAILLPDDSDDEDYHEEANGAAYSSEEDSDAEMSEGYGGGRAGGNGDEEDEEGPVTRSRAGRVRRSSTPEESSVGGRASHHRTRGTSSGSGGRRGRGRGRRSGRGRPPMRDHQRVTRTTRRRRATLDDDDEIPVHSDDDDIDIMHGGRTDEEEAQSDEDEDSPVRPRRRRGRVQISYLESDLEDSPSESEQDEAAEDDDDQEEEKEDGEGDDAIVDEEDEAGGSSETLQQPEDDEDSDHSPVIDRKGKRRLRSSGAADSDDYDDDSEFRAEASVRVSKRRAIGRRKPERAQPVSRPTVTATIGGGGGGGGRSQRGKTRNLSEDEILYYEPRDWLQTTHRTVTKYHPQTNDYVGILTEGHEQYWEQSELKSYFDERHGPIETDEPVLFGQVIGIHWQVGPPTYCRLKLRLRNLVNIREALAGTADPIWATKYRDVTIDFSDEDGCPEFLVLWEQFVASMNILRTLRVGQRVDALYDVGKYTGRIESTKSGASWRRARLPNPWTYYHIIWDDEESSPEDLSPWEIVPSGEDFYERYDVGNTLSIAETKRAQDIINWLMQNSDFELYVHQVDYYQYRNYLPQIAYPICLQMILERLNHGFYRQKQAVIDDVELIRKNAQKYNHETSAANKDAVRMANFFKSRFQNPRMPISWSKVRGRRAQAQESDEEYEQVDEEDEHSPSMDEAPPESPGDESEFVDDDDDDGY
ncbi:hypothetical protein BDB00DRAFT_839128 [Zychaea mexicana]|uniref:uncharacterized protein n=1 Tax=Zychaea mexicana TaxID=64656 RepID=UPI0022FF44B2|nr:uncharacterized protein BDB00DRAFT_839128 [Zychaea mexicana]KAI9490135.1 hypothetical protein BDB00DRAFT_839128 [Zychaea mexicana]